MATTILKNLKEAKNRKPSQHLHNAINYIMNPEKTESLFCLQAVLSLSMGKLLHSTQQ